VGVVIDGDGIEWLTIPDAARKARVREDTLRQWKRRGKVRAHTVEGRVWLHMGDVLASEKAWRVRVGT
jgi:hypothetical protein